MRIGELSTATGVRVRSLRYYQQQGLLAATRGACGQRLYQPDAVERVQLIQKLFRAGLCSGVMAQLLPSIEYPALRTAELEERLADERGRLTKDIEDLLLARNTLDEVILSVTTSQDGRHRSAAR